MSKYLFDINESFKNYKKFYVSKIKILKQTFKTVEKVEFSDEENEENADFVRFRKLNHNPKEYNLSTFERILRERNFFRKAAVRQNDKNI